ACAPATLDPVCARCPASCAGRDEETGSKSNKETDPWPVLCRRAMTLAASAVHAFRPRRCHPTKATDHELQKYGNFTRYGHQRDGARDRYRQSVRSDHAKTEAER